MFARQQDAMSNVELIGHRDGLTAVKTVLEVLSRNMIGALGDQVNDLTICIILQTIVQASIATCSSAAVGQCARGREGLHELGRWHSIQALAVCPRPLAVE
jgi:hypothetical protein